MLRLILTTALFVLFSAPSYATPPLQFELYLLCTPTPHVPTPAYEPVDVLVEIPPGASTLVSNAYGWRFEIRESRTHAPLYVQDDVVYAGDSWIVGGIMIGGHPSTVLSHRNENDGHAFQLVFWDKQGVGHSEDVECYAQSRSRNGGASAHN